MMFSKKMICMSLANIAILLGVLGCAMEQQETPSQLKYNAVERHIQVDGDIDDWHGIEKNVVQGPEHLWIGQGMTRDKWRDNDDLSFSWSAAWRKDKLYFLVEVTDNNPQPCVREFSWINDCVEIQLDPRNLEGERVEKVKIETTLQERLGKKLRGYEMHFLPCSPPRVYLDDTQTIYRLENFQNDIFFHKWDGKIETRLTDNGYLLEIGFTVPDLKLKPDMIIGLDVAVGDDDGNERKSLMTWTGKQVAFWITMDYFGKMTLVK